ncbi:MAG: hypothetical protein HZA22_05715 [Nitrospirae bacterium]|nr:hypothetical protein [Nitrospirota bacterium]MBI5694376.1 hypothetical protein [Nitrospirota bacterium]
MIICMTALAGAGPIRPMMRGYPVGRVVEVNKDAGLVSVDLGSSDGVLKGMGFAVVDAKGGQAAAIAAGEVYADRFWSVKLPADKARKVRPGMEVRWLLTPEVIALSGAVKKGSPESYKEFIATFPSSGFIPEVIDDLPETTLREISPEYYEAWKAYTRYSFEEFIEKHPGTGFALAAQAELGAIEEFEAEGERIRKGREERAKAAEAERARQQAVEDKIRERQERASRRESLGKLVNNSDTAVRFVFDPPSEQSPVAVLPGSYSEIRHVAGSYTYKVFPVEDPDAAPAVREFGPDGEAPLGPTPLKEGEADTEFDFWEIEYP